MPNFERWKEHLAFTLASVSIQRLYSLGSPLSLSLLKFDSFSNQSCQRYALQMDIAGACNCFHPYLVQPGLPEPVGVLSCLITPSVNGEQCDQLLD